MPDPVILPAAAWTKLVVRALERSGATAEQARPTARALVAAEADGQGGHGLSRVPGYVAQLRSGKVDGRAVPRLERLTPAASRVDAGGGFAYPALELAAEAAAASARRQAVAAVAVRRSHHFGQAGAHVERLAEAGCVALLFGNSPRAMAFHGSASGAPRLGTNPLAFAAPVPGRPPLVVDLATAAAARGRIVAAQKAGRPIPEGWAVDVAGAPTTDPDAALGGALLPLGGAKGSALALMIEVLAAALTGSAFGWEASSLFEAEGPAPDLGQCLLALDPGALNGGAGGGFGARMAALAAAVAEDGARLPGDRRLELRARAAARGVAAPEALHDEIRALTVA